MVNLAEVARVLGAKVTPNKELGTVDVYLVDRVATPSGGDWSSDPAGGKSPSQVVMAMMATMKNLPSAESLLAMKNEADLKAGMGVMEDLAKQQLPYMSKAMQAQMKEKMKASRAQMASQKPPAQAAEEGADNPFMKLAPSAVPASAELFGLLEQGEVDGDFAYQAWADHESNAEVADLYRLNGREETRHGERVTEVRRLLGAL